MSIERKIVEYKDYGKMNIKIKGIMDARDVSVYQLSKETGLEHQTVKSYYNNDPLTKVDMDVLAKLCYVMGCDINDILEYNPPEE